MCRALLPYLALVAAVGCRGSTAARDNPALGCADTIAVAREAGADYLQVVDGCLRREHRSLHRLFWLTRHAGFDAASGQGNAAILGTVLRRTGDDFFGGQLASEPPDVRREVHDSLLYDFGWGNTDITLSGLKGWYPKTFAGCERAE